MAIRKNRLGDRWKSWWAKGAIAGIIGAIPMAIYLMLTCAFVGLGWLFPMNAIATNWVRFRPAGPDFVPAALATGTLEHLIMAAIWGIGLAAILSRFGRLLTGTLPRAIGTGLFWGLLAFSVTGVVIGAGISPAVMRLPRGHWFIAHLIYGVTTALALRYLLVRPQVRVTFAPTGTAVPRERTFAGGGE